MRTGTERPNRSVPERSALLGEGYQLMHQPIVHAVTAADASAQCRRETPRQRVPKGAPIIKNTRKL